MTRGDRLLLALSAVATLVGGRRLPTDSTTVRLSLDKAREVLERYVGNAGVRLYPAYQERWWSMHALLAEGAPGNARVLFDAGTFQRVAADLLIDPLLEGVGRFFRDVASGELTEKDFQDKE